MIDWAAVCDVATQIHGTPCCLGPINFGGVHMIRQIVFEADVRWIIRIPMPRRIINKNQSFRIENKDEYWARERREAMEIELYTMKYIREHSTIPVPEVFAFDSTVDNPIGAPYMFMECVMGNAITDLTSWSEIPVERIAKIHTAMAKFQFELSTLHFDQIGNVCGNEDGKYYIGPIPGIGGPFSNSTDYYRAWGLANKHRRGKPDQFPDRVSSAAEILSAKPSGPFTLSHPDFGYHNFIVVDEYNVLAVIDWDGARVQPIEFSAILPMSLSFVHPIFWEGGRLDNEVRRKEEVEQPEERDRYGVMEAEAVKCNLVSVMLQSQSLRVLIADGMNRWVDGSMNPWEWLIDLLELVLSGNSVTNVSGYRSIRR